jgi:predicted DNA-binding transcriptional regulator YafY
MGRSSRLFEIIQILRRACGPVSAQYIAATLEVSQRTICRDIATLQGMRVPIEGEAGIGYVMQGRFELPPLTFTDDEIEAIVVGLSLIGRTGDADLLAAASRVGRKISAVLPTPMDHGIESSALYVSQWNGIPSSMVEYRLMRQAIREERKLRLQYEDVEGQGSDRIICPLSLVYYIDSVILAAWCELRCDFRHFRMDRMRVCVPLDAFFKGEGNRLRAEWQAQHELFLSN